MLDENDLLDDNSTPFDFMKGPSLQLKAVIPDRLQAFSKCRALRKLFDPLCSPSTTGDTANFVSDGADGAENNVGFSKHLRTKRRVGYDEGRSIYQYNLTYKDREKLIHPCVNAVFVRAVVCEDA
jgi:hypothetical protein